MEVEETARRARLAGLELAGRFQLAHVARTFALPCHKQASCATSHASERDGGSGVFCAERKHRAFSVVSAEDRNTALELVYQQLVRSCCCPASPLVQFGPVDCPARSNAQVADRELILAANEADKETGAATPIRRHRRHTCCAAATPYGVRSKTAIRSLQGARCLRRGPCPSRTSNGSNWAARSTTRSSPG